MTITFHSHHAPLSPRLKSRTERALMKLGDRIGSPTSANVLFEEDGPERRVEIVLRAARNRRFVATATSRYFGTSVTRAIRRIDAQVRGAKRLRKSEGRRVDRA
jgi:hypothetical protein